MRNLQHLFRREDGVAALEFGLAAPLLLVLLLGTIEASLFLLINMKTDKVTFTLGDLVAQSSALDAAQLTDIMEAAGQVMQPYAFAARGVVIVSSVQEDAMGVPKVLWQETGGGTLPETSKVGAAGGAATLPGGLTLNGSENVIVAEVYYNYAPLATSSIIGETLLYKHAVFKPRLGALTALQ